jgi:hypothetical protein
VAWSMPVRPQPAASILQDPRELALAHMVPPYPPYTHRQNPPVVSRSKTTGTGRRRPEGSGGWKGCCFCWARVRPHSWAKLPGSLAAALPVNAGSLGPCPVPGAGGGDHAGSAKRASGLSMGLLCWASRRVEQPSDEGSRGASW